MGVTGSKAHDAPPSALEFAEEEELDPALLAALEVFDAELMYDVLACEVLLDDVLPEMLSAVEVDAGLTAEAELAAALLELIFFMDPVTEPELPAKVKVPVLDADGPWVSAAAPEAGGPPHPTPNDVARASASAPRAMEMVRDLVPRIEVWAWFMF